MSDTLEIRNGHLQYGKPEIVSIIGPNGSGKSTLLKALGRLLKPTGGAVYLNGKDLKELKSEAVAKHISVLPQSAQAPGDMTVRELAACGRIPYQSAFSQLSQDDEAAVEHALKVTGLTSNIREPVPCRAVRGREPGWPWPWLRNRKFCSLMNRQLFWMSIISLS